LTPIKFVWFVTSNICLFLDKYYNITGDKPQTNLIGVKL